MQRVKVVRMSIAPVKGFALVHPDELELTEHGAVENRRFLLVDGDGARLRSSLTAWPVVVHASYDAAAEVLRMRFPDGTEVEGSALGSGSPFAVDYHGQAVESRFVEGGWDERLSELAGHPVRVVRPERLGQVLEEPVTVVSLASVERLAEEAGRPGRPAALPDAAWTSTAARRTRRTAGTDGASPSAGRCSGWAVPSRAAR